MQSTEFHATPWNFYKHRGILLNRELKQNTTVDDVIRVKLHTHTVKLLQLTVLSTDYGCAEANDGKLSYASGMI